MSAPTPDSEPLRPLPDPKIPPKFRAYARVRHVGRGSEYVILSTPEEGDRDARTGERVYRYFDLYDRRAVWVRPQSEMEDGRFVRVE